MKTIIITTLTVLTAFASCEEIEPVGSTTTEMYEPGLEYKF